MKGQEIAGKVRQIRKTLKLTQNQFAELVGLSVDSIGKIERGVGVPTIDTICKISTAARMPVGELLAPQKKKETALSSNALYHLTAYMKTRSAADVEFIHRIAVMILERRK